MPPKISRYFVEALALLGAASLYAYELFVLLQCAPSQ